MSNVNAVCPECGEAQLIYDKVEREEVRGRLLTIDIDSAEDGYALDETEDGFSSYSLFTESIECGACDQTWTELYNLSRCLMMVRGGDHEPDGDNCWRES